MRNVVPVFLACDDHFVKYTIVSVTSMIENADPTRKYHVHVLHAGVSEQMQQQLLALENDAFSITFDDVTEFLPEISKKLPIRDYFTSSTYFRMFIPDMFPEYDKAVYIDSDTIVLGDISKLYDHDMGENYIGGVHDQVIVQLPVFGEYAEQVLGISRHEYFSAGVLLFNCKQFREKRLFDRFVALLNAYDFVVAQDQDYLNLVCKDRVLWIDRNWNMQVFEKILEDESAYKIVHYIMASKPWHSPDCRLKSYFWHYAEKTAVIDEIRADLANYTDAQRLADAEGGQRLMRTARQEIERDDNYLKTLRASQSPDRVTVLARIEQLEREGRFDVDVEDDPPSRTLKPEEIDYLRKSAYSRIKTKMAFSAAQHFVAKLIRAKKLIIKGIEGLEHFAGLTSGAVITCNHFNAFDSFAIQLAYQAADQRSRRFYRVIREGNYTNFPGFYGYLMKNCDTLPLSSDFETMKKFMQSTNQLLQEGNFVLFYPEQSMWWNYRKPKPLKDGAFKFAAKNRVPVLPCFITMRDSDLIGEDGFPIQEYTIHIGAPLYPESGRSVRENIETLRRKNYQCWQQIYERAYGIPLQYTTEVREGTAVGV